VLKLKFVKKGKEVVALLREVQLTRKKKILVAIAAIMVVASAFYFIVCTSKNAEPILKVVEVVTAAPQSIEQTVRLIGTVRAKHSTVLMAKTTGVLETLKQSGETVTKGTLIARIINPDIEKRYEFAVSTAHIAKDQYERTMTLMKTGASSKQSVEEKQFIYLEAERNLATAKIELDKIRFYAPFDGVIGAYKGRDGTEIKDGSALLVFYDPLSMVVEVDIPAPIVSLINVGQKVMIDKKHYALTQIQKMLDESTHMAPAVVNIVAEGHIVGMPIDVELTISEKSNAIVLPDEVVFLEQGNPHVYVIKDSKTVLTPVELGLRAQENVEITKGLNTGDIVVSQGQGRLSKDMTIKIYDPKADNASNEVKNKSRENKNELNHLFH
jgi:membrane fusion protein (multidrug efflux system)